MNTEKELLITERLTEEAMERAATMLRAMAHPQRLAIVELLDQKGTLSVGEIQEFLGLEQAAASHHLGVMRDRGLLLAERKGRQVYYALRYERIAHVVECVEKCQLNQADIAEA